MATLTSRAGRLRRHHRVRRRISGTKARPRLAVFRSLNHIYAQLIADDDGRTLLTVSSLDPVLRGEKVEGGKIGMARRVGEVLAERARQSGIDACVFDRGGYLYHGRVAALAEGARSAGLRF